MASPRPPRSTDPFEDCYETIDTCIGEEGALRGDGVVGRHVDIGENPGESLRKAIEDFEQRRFWEDAEESVAFRRAGAGDRAPAPLWLEEEEEDRASRASSLAERARACRRGGEVDLASWYDMVRGQMRDILPREPRGQASRGCAREEPRGAVTRGAVTRGAAMRGARSGVWDPWAELHAPRQSARDLAVNWCGHAGRFIPNRRAVPPAIAWWGGRFIDTPCFELTGGEPVGGTKVGHWVAARLADQQGYLREKTEEGEDSDYAQMRAILFSLLGNWTPFAAVVCVIHLRRLLMQFRIGERPADALARVEEAALILQGHCFFYVEAEDARVGAAVDYALACCAEARQALADPSGASLTREGAYRAAWTHMARALVAAFDAAVLFRTPPAEHH